MILLYNLIIMIPAGSQFLSAHMWNFICFCIIYSIWSLKAANSCLNTRKISYDPSVWFHWCDPGMSNRWDLTWSFCMISSIWSRNVKQVRSYMILLYDFIDVIPECHWSLYLNTDEISCDPSVWFHLCDPGMSNRWDLIWSFCMISSMWSRNVADPYIWTQMRSHMIHLYDFIDVIPDCRWSLYLNTDEISHDPSVWFHRCDPGMSLILIYLNTGEISYDVSVWRIFRTVRMYTVSLLYVSWCGVLESLSGRTFWHTQCTDRVFHRCVFSGVF